MDQRNAYNQVRPGGSPLRFSKLPKGDDAQKDEDLRRQISSKEKEIQNLSKHSEFLKSRLDESMKQPRGSNRDRSPAPTGPPAYIKDHLSALQNDNTSLMRRLNLVLQELDRVQKEKEDLQKAFVGSTKQTHDLQRLLNEEDNMDKANRYMHDDLAYEKDRNDNLREKVKEEELIKNKLLKELDIMRDSSEDTAQRNAHYTTELHKKIGQDLEKEHYYTQEKIKQLATMIDEIEEDDQKTNIEKQDLQRVMNALIQERNELIRRLDVLTRKYDDAVREISSQRQALEGTNKEHQKYLAAKILFTELEKISSHKKKTGLDELQKYNKFDSKCNLALSRFANVLERAGHYRLRQALVRWHSNALKPGQARVQSHFLAIQGDNVRSLGKFFHLWRNLFQQRLEAYDMKAQAIRIVCGFTKSDLKKEVKRSFDIWKGHKIITGDKRDKLAKVIQRTMFGSMAKAFTQWAGRSKEIDQQIRLGMLAQQFTQQQASTVLFHGLRKACYEQKQRRYVKQFHFFKAWKDYIAHKKYLLNQNVASFHFVAHNKGSLLKACFDALKQHKEEEKLIKTEFALTQDEKPMINGLENEIAQREATALKTAQTRACQAITAMGARNIGTYFQHWRKRCEFYDETMNTKVKDRIIKVYMDRLRHFFERWRVNKESDKVERQMEMITMQQEEGAAIAAELETVEKEIEKKEQGLDKSQKSQTLKCVTSFNRRLLQIAMGRWRDRCVSLNNGENAADVVIRRMRARLCREAFERYKAMTKLAKKEDKDEERCEYFNKTRDERLKDRTLAAWIMYTKNFHRAKEYWYRLFLRLDLSMKRRAVKKWRDNSQFTIEETFETQQQALVENIQQLNEEAGKLSTKDESQRTQNKDLKGKMTNQAKRVIKNAFARFYYVGETRGFEKWKEYVEDQKRKERLMKKMLGHWKNYQFYFLKAALKNWMLNSDIQERTGQLKHEEMLVHDTKHALDLQSKTFQGLQNKLNNELEAVKNEQTKYNDRLRKHIGTMITHTDNTHYMSKRRYILSIWRQYVATQKGFILSIENVVNKSLWKEGFCAIREFSRDHQRNELVDTVMNRFRQKFWKRTCGNAFSNWRGAVFSNVVMHFEEASSELQERIDDHQQKVADLKAKNSDQATRVVHTHYLQNLFIGWKTVTDFQKLQQTKDYHLVEALAFRDKSYAVKHWLSRVRATRLARHRNKQLIQRYHQMRLQFFFDALKTNYKQTKGLADRLSNLANVMDTQSCKVAFQTIASYSRSKAYVQKQKKDQSCKSLDGILSNLYLRRLGHYFKDLNSRGTRHHQDRKKKMSMVIYNMSNKLRQAFLTWSKQAQKINVAIEMQEEGPVREQIFEERQKLKNLENFMAKEGYEPDQIQVASVDGCSYRKKLMLKTIKRMQHYNDDEGGNYLKPKVIDLWKKYVFYKKALRYWLDYVDRRSEYIKCDLAVAFDRWKWFYSKHRGELEKMPREKLENRIVKNSKTLNQMADHLVYQEETLEHLENQRDALVENYIKGQRVALALWNNKIQVSQWKQFSLWKETADDERNKELADQLKKNVELITQLKDKMKKVEKDNIDLANENEELRQFSLDGYEIAKNVQSLAKERENLSVDLADKATTIRKLLDENEALQGRLRLAQDEASHLLQVSKSGHKGGFSQTPVKGT